jgi:uncharacterized protein (TIGR02145 family)
MVMTYRNFLLPAALLGILLSSGCNTSEEDDDDDEVPPQISVAPDAPLTDYDGNVYATVKIGDQVWMAENLRVTHYRNGAFILPVQANDQWLNSLTQGAYCYYDNQQSNAADYGALYNGLAIQSSNNLAPAGWRIPTASDLEQLRVYLYGFELNEGCLKETGTDHWEAPNTGATNSALFNALPGGYRFNDGSFRLKGYEGHWWLSSGTTGFLLLYDDALMGTFVSNSQQGYSVRCIKE